MRKTKKHAAPLLCRLEVALRGRSPSRAIYCHIGSRGAQRRKCQGCKENISGAIYGGIAEAFKSLGEQASAMAKSIEASAKAAKEAAQR